MDIKDIRKIIEMMKENELAEFELEDEGFRIAIKRANGNAPQVVIHPGNAAPAPLMMQASVPAANLAAETQPGTAGGAPAAGDPYEKITSPMVGSFYRAPSPDADPFVSLGSEVDEDTVVCIVEAMKVMNEIKAETRGTIRKILLENGDPVQFGQPMFFIEPA